MTLNKHVFLLKYGTKKQREDSIKPALHHIEHDADHTEDSADRMSNYLWHHVDYHGDNPEMKEFLTRLDHMVADAQADDD